MPGFFPGIVVFTAENIFTLNYRFYYMVYILPFKVIYFFSPKISERYSISCLVILQIRFFEQKSLLILSRRVFDYLILFFLCFGIFFLLSRREIASPDMGISTIRLKIVIRPIPTSPRSQTTV